MKKLILFAAVALFATTLQLPAQGRGRGFHRGRGQGMAQSGQRCGQQCRGRAECCQRTQQGGRPAQAPSPARQAAPSK